MKDRNNEIKGHPSCAHCGGALDQVGRFMASLSATSNDCPSTMKGMRIEANTGVKGETFSISPLYDDHRSSVENTQLDMYRCEHEVT